MGTEEEVDGDVEVEVEVSGGVARGSEVTEPIGLGFRQRFQSAGSRRVLLGSQVESWYARVHLVQAINRIRRQVQSDDRRPHQVGYGDPVYLL